MKLSDTIKVIYQSTVNSGAAIVIPLAILTICAIFGPVLLKVIMTTVWAFSLLLIAFVTMVNIQLALGSFEFFQKKQSEAQAFAEKTLVLGEKIEKPPWDNFIDIVAAWEDLGKECLYYRIILDGDIIGNLAHNVNEGIVGISFPLDVNALDMHTFWYVEATPELAVERFNRGERKSAINDTRLIRSFNKPNYWS